jgi:uncharacterized membrane protein
VEIPNLITPIATILSYFGVIVIAYGGAVAAFQTLYRGLKRSRRPTYTRIRGEFAQKIIFGLDFLISSDILNTILAPSLDEVARLGGIVVIRTILTFVLSKETNELRAEEQGKIATP